MAIVKSDIGGNITVRNYLCKITVIDNSKVISHSSFLSVIS
uniref:Uncharacterized protein n=1 Tax=Arundo donax TaxID=35708 RepID=A0A0A9FZS9_ARUDO